MYININNYEEYFLLYADNELTAEEKNTVELFVQQNIELEEEFLLLRQSVVRPDSHIALGDKSFLFKKGEESISSNNYTEKFILYNDYELTGEERTETEKIIKGNKFLEQELDFLKRVKMHPEMSIVFPDKKLLYKKENAKVISFKWWKVAAAAILLGFGLWTGITYTQDETEIAVTINDDDKIKPANKINAPATVVSKEAANVSMVGKFKNQSPLKNQSSLSGIEKHEKPPVAASVKKKTAIIKYQEEKKAGKAMDQNSNNNAVNNNNNVDTQKKNNDIANNSIYDLEPASDIIIHTDEIITNIDPAKNYALTVSSVIDDINEPEDDNYIFYNVSAEKFNKSKVGGFFKKVKRIIQRKSPFSRNADNKVDVAPN